jgi:hypothetical protein
MAYSPILVVHICAGSLGLLSGTAAISFRKGSRRHVLAGKVFVASMLTMGAATYLAITRYQPNNIGGGILTVYLIGTAWLTGRRRDGEIRRLDCGLRWLFPWRSVSFCGSLALKRSLALHHQKTEFPAVCTFSWVRCVCLLPRGTFACWCAAVFLEQSASRVISGACVLGCSSLPDPFSLEARTAR